MRLGPLGTVVDETLASQGVLVSRGESKDEAFCFVSYDDGKTWHDWRYLWGVAAGQRDYLHRLGLVE